MTRVVHIRNEARTREELDYVGSSLPDGAAVAWCGRDASNQFFYLDASHALTDLTYGGGTRPCRSCLLSLRKVIDSEIEARARPTVLIEITEETTAVIGDTLRFNGCVFTCTQPTAPRDL